MKVIDWKAADGLLVAKVALAATVGAKDARPMSRTEQGKNRVSESRQNRNSESKGIQ
jgi:hypothetical protein